MSERPCAVCEERPGTWPWVKATRICVPCLRKQRTPEPEVASGPVPLIERQHTNVYVAPKALTILAVAEPCRFCELDAFTADETGPLHVCCQSWAAELAKGKPCPACAESRRQAREWAQRQAIQGKQRRKAKK